MKSVIISKTTTINESFTSLACSIVKEPRVVSFAWPRVLGQEAITCSNERWGVKKYHLGKNEVEIFPTSHCMKIAVD